MLNIQDLRIDPASLDRKMLLVDVMPAYEYKDGKRTETVTGYRYVVCLAEHPLEKLSVRIDGPQQMEQPEGFVDVEFTDLAVTLLYGHEVQAELDGGDKAVLAPEEYLQELAGFSLGAPDCPLADFFLRLEILTPQWKSRLEAPTVRPEWNNEHRSLLRYFLCRYWLQAVSDYDLVCRVKFAVSACLLIGHLGGDLIETAQLFSKEIENDPDNVDAILDGAYTAPELTDSNLLAYCITKY